MFRGQLDHERSRSVANYRKPIDEYEYDEYVFNSDWHGSVGRETENGVVIPSYTCCAYKSNNTTRATASRIVVSSAPYY